MKKFFVFLLVLLLSSALWAQNRYALVIGNANYPRAEDRLPNAINDTNDIGKALRELGYQVEIKQNLQHLDMVKEIEAFINRLKNNRNSEGFFWYAGHAIEIAGESFFMPLNVNLESDELTKATTYSINNLTRQLDSVQNKINVVVLDACRIPPTIGGRGRSSGDVSRVIRPVTLSSPDLFMVYSTSPGTVASDGIKGSRNSPFAQAFLKNIKSTEPLLIMMGHVTSDTLSLTKQNQRPNITGSMGRENSYYSLYLQGGEPSTSTNMVLINGGTFTMGNPTIKDVMYGREGSHQVTVNSFYMGKYEVTQKEFVAVMRKNTSNFRGDLNLPVEQVSWFDAIKYCNELSHDEGLTPVYTIIGRGSYSEIIWNRNANGYRLPTEAEWEYACRAGTTTPFNTGNNITTSQANYNSEHGDRTTSVGSFAPNAWGLYDMHGNVAEWCWDWYGDYSLTPQNNPVGISPISGGSRVLRGGNWSWSAEGISSSLRGYHSPDESYDIFGFRVVRNAPGVTYTPAEVK